MTSLRILSLSAFITLLLLNNPCHAQQRVAFWNVENFYDTQRDSTIADEEFTPRGNRHWTRQRFERKRNAIAKTIMAMGTPAVIGMAEVENRYVLTSLCYDTPLSAMGYEVVHHDSRDRRGIDCGLLYRKSLYTLVSDTIFRLPDTAESSRTRDLLMALLASPLGDTLCCFVCHLPSKLGGAQHDNLRSHIAQMLAHLMDSMQVAHPSAIVLAMGDMNADAREVALMTKGSDIVNLMHDIKEGEGTYNYKDVWQLIDHFLATKKSSTEFNGKIFDAEFLMEHNKRKIVSRPFRTYRGTIYNGGISDHLPIYLDLPNSKHTAQ